MPDAAQPGTDRPRGDRRISVMLVDDHPVVRSGLAHAFGDEPDFVVCCECGNIGEALVHAQAEAPDMAIVDLSLGGVNGLDLVKAFAASHPRIRVLVLSMHDELLFAERALLAGAAGYIMKDRSIQEVLTAARRVADGDVFVSDSVAQRLFSAVAGGGEGIARVRLHSASSRIGNAKCSR